MKNLLFKDWKHGNDIGILLLRVVFAYVLLYGHGLEKLGIMFSGQEPQFFDAIGIGANLSFYLAGFAEGICGLLLLFGILARPAALILSINFMVITYFHAKISADAFGVLELRYLYLIGFITLFFTGAGKFSLDYLIFGGKKKR